MWWSMMAEYGGRATCTVADVVFVSIIGTILRWMHGGLVDIEVVDDSSVCSSLKAFLLTSHDPNAFFFFFGLFKQCYG